MRFCTRCFYPENHPLGITFNAEGVCSGCRIHDEKFNLDWQAREVKLQTILDAFRDQSGSTYDCIVPISGARDSFFIVDLLKRKYGMKPLTVMYNRHYNTLVGIRNLALLRTRLDCDFLQLVLQPQTVRRIMRETFHRTASFHWHAIAGQTVFPVQIAVRLKIPLIIWGVHQGCDQVGMFSHTDEVEMTRKYRHEHDLLGLEAEDLVDGVERLSETELRPLMYPHDTELAKVGVRGIYLSNYIPWDTKAFHETMLDRYGYEAIEQQRTFDTYNEADCVHYNGAHDLIKFAKWGYSKVTDHATREMRWGRLTREQGAVLIRRFRDRHANDLGQLLEFIEISEAKFHETVDRHRDPRAWKEVDGEWRLRFDPLQAVGHAQSEAPAADPMANCEFRVNRRLERQENEDYPLLHRGWVE